MITKITNIGKPSVSLKEQINVVTQRLELQTKNVDNAVQRFEMRDAEIFRRVVKAMSERIMQGQTFWPQNFLKYAR